MDMDKIFIAGLKGMSAGFALGVLVAIIALLVFIYKKFILPKINKTKDIASAISNHGTEAIKGYMEKHAHTTKTNFSNENDDMFYEYVLEEIEKNDLQKGLWAKALALSEGNNDKAKSLYMQHRVKAIKEELSRLAIDPSSLSPQRIWHILANGITPEEQASLQEEREENLNIQKKQNAKKENEKYTKFGGWLIFFGFLIVLGNLQILSVFELLGSGHQETLTYLFVNEHYAIADHSKNVSYLLFFGIFLQIMLTITFFRKSILMKSVTIFVFIGTILIAIMNAWLFFSLQANTPPELFNTIFKPSVVYKIYMTPILSLLPALVWILYFSFSQRAKKTFVKEHDLLTLVIISAIIPFLFLVTYHDNTQREIESNIKNRKYEYFNLGYNYANGENGVKQDSLKAAEYYEISCDYGNADACNNLGAMYVDNQIVHNYLKAVEFYEKAINIGNATACNNLAALYSNGLGVKRDYLKAKELYERACNGGDAKACSNFAFLNDEKNSYYDIGKNYLAYDLDYKKAKEYLDISCHKGNEKACLNIGHIYSNGLGVAPDESKALEFYQKACNGGNTEGCNLSKKVNIIHKPAPEPKFTCKEVINGQYLSDIEKWEKRGKFGFSREIEDLMLGFCKHGDTSRIQTYIDFGYVEKSEVESIIKLLGLKFDIEIKNQSEEGKRIAEARNKFYDMRLCSACASSAAYYFVVKPNSKCGKIARKALEGDKKAIEEASNIGSGDYCE